MSFIGYSAKALSRAPRALGKEKQPSRQAPLTASLSSANLAGTRHRFFIFFKKNLCRVPPGRRSAKFEFFFQKFFAECPLAGTRQSLIFFKKKIFAECPLAGTRQSLNFFLKKFFAECHGHGTRQRGPLPSVTLGKVSQNGNF